MKAYLIYERFEAARNAWFANRFIELGKERGVDLRLLVREELTLSFEGSLSCFIYEGERLDKPGFVINRTQDHILAKHFENAGIPVFNNSEVCSIANNKMLTFELASKLGLPFMETRYHTGNDADLCFPSVIKPVDGKGGKNVMLIKDGEALKAALPLFEGKPFLSQKVAKTPGRDLRLYVLGGRVIASFMRLSSNDDLRSNFGIHGRAVPAVPEKPQLEAAKKIVGALKPDFVGIDFIFDGERTVFNEVEDCVGSRMVYAYTDIDVAKEYLDHILKSVF